MNKMSINIGVNTPEREKNKNGREEIYRLN